MSRILTVGAAQLGPVAKSESRKQVVGRLIELLRQAADRRCDLVVFTELALTTFFPRWYMEDQAEVDAWFEREMPGPETRPLFDEAAKLGIGFYLGYAERSEEHTSELQSLMRTSYAVFCLKKKKNNKQAPELQ